MTRTLRSDLPLKYYLELYNNEKTFDSKSLLYNIILYLAKVKDSDNSLKFTTKIFKYIFGDKLNNETFKAILVKNLKELLSNGDVTVTDSTFYISEQALTYFYTTK
jgi:hypothetical protein